MAKVLDIDEEQLCDGPFLAKLLDLDIRTITRLTKQGVLHRKARGKYRLFPSITSYAVYVRAQRAGAGDDEEDEQTYDYERERARLYKERADAAAMDNQLRRGTLHDGEIVARVCNEKLAAFRARMLAIPTKVAPVVADIETVQGCFDAIEAEVRLGLEELSNYDPTPVVNQILAELSGEDEEGGDEENAEDQKQA